MPLSILEQILYPTRSKDSTYSLNDFLWHVKIIFYWFHKHLQGALQSVFLIVVILCFPHMNSLTSLGEMPSFFSLIIFMALASSSLFSSISNACYFHSLVYAFHGKQTTTKYIGFSCGLLTFQSPSFQLSPKWGLYLSYFLFEKFRVYGMGFLVFPGPMRI